MVQDFILTSPKLLPFYETFPRDVTCWHFNKKTLRNKADVAEYLHRVLIVDLHMDNWLLAHATWEWDAFRYKSVKKLLRKRNVRSENEIR